MVYNGGFGCIGVVNGTDCGIYMSSHKTCTGFAFFVK